MKSFQHCGRAGTLADRAVTKDTLAVASDEALACRLCESVLPLGPRPVFRVSDTARVLIVGQAPGIFPPTVRAGLSKLSYAQFWDESINGRLPLSDAVLQLSLVAFWLYATYKVLESRRWS